jgi:hypothetical protein
MLLYVTWLWSRVLESFKTVPRLDERIPGDVK